MVADCLYGSRGGIWTSDTFVCSYVPSKFTSQKDSLREGGQAILALIGFVMYRQSGHTESYIEVLLLVTVVLQILAMIVLKVAPDFKWTSLLLTANAILTAAALVNSFYTQVDFIGYVVSGLYEFATIKKFIISAVLMALSMIAYIVSSYSGFQKCTCKDETKA